MTITPNDALRAARAAVNLALVRECEVGIPAAQALQDLPSIVEMYRDGSACMYVEVNEDADVEGLARIITLGASRIGVDMAVCVLPMNAVLIEDNDVEHDGGIAIALCCTQPNMPNLWEMYLVHVDDERLLFQRVMHDHVAEGELDTGLESAWTREPLQDTRDHMRAELGERAMTRALVSVLDGLGHAAYDYQELSELLDLFRNN